MGHMMEGQWRAGPLPRDESGAYARPESEFRDRIEDGGRFAPEPGRYHLYVSHACPWAHRALIFRAIKGLEDMIGISAVNAYMGDDGWSFEPGEGVIPDTVNGATYLREIYAKADPRYTGRVTTPVLWDTREDTIVNNESAEIIRILNSAFDEGGATPGDYYPEGLREEIDRINARVYDTVNNGVYKAGFAANQQAYEKAVVPLFESLDWLENLLSKRRYLAGDRITEADWRLFTTLIRFDAVYATHFKCNLRRIADYPNLWDFTRSLYQAPGVAETVNFPVIKTHYFTSHAEVNPTGIVPLGFAMELDEPGTRVPEI